MKKLFIILSMVIAALPAHAEYLYGFGNISVNYLDWTEGSEMRSVGFKEDFVLLELEGGAGFDWGELYGFLDLENVQDGADKVRSAFKGTATYKTGLGELRLYGQSYGTHSENANWFVHDNILGVSYAFSRDGWWFNPFIGAHHTNTTDFTGMNGGIAGWVTGYNFDAFGESFMISNWHETEFARVDDYVNKPFNSETDDLSMNGALSFWWNITNHMTTGIQYRYSDNKLGQGSYANAMIYTVKYNF